MYNCITNIAILFKEEYIQLQLAWINIQVISLLNFKNKNTSKKIENFFYLNYSNIKYLKKIMVNNQLIRIIEAMNIQNYIRL